MTWEDLLKLLVDSKKNDPTQMGERVVMIIDNERWYVSIVEDLVTGKLLLTPSFGDTEEEDNDDD